MSKELLNILNKKYSKYKSDNNNNNLCGGCDYVVNNKDCDNKGKIKSNYGFWYLNKLVKKIQGANNCDLVNIGNNHIVFVENGNHTEKELGDKIEGMITFFKRELNNFCIEFYNNKYLIHLIPMPLLKNKEKINDIKKDNTQDNSLSIMTTMLKYKKEDTKKKCIKKEEHKKEFNGIDYKYEVVNCDVYSNPNNVAEKVDNIISKLITY